jgi:glutamate dehydrogenase/leucine dehydrogenase
MGDTIDDGSVKAIQVIADRGLRVTGGDGFTQQVRTLVQTNHENGARAFTAFVESSPLFDRSVGGSRIVRATTDEAARIEVTKLAAGMSAKNPGAGIPANGQKSVVVWPDAPASDEARAALLAAHYREVLKFEPGAIFGPDMAVGEHVQDAVAAHPDLTDHIAGNSRDGFGVAIDETGWTGRALVLGLGAWDGTAQLKSAAIQGFGAVGAWAAKQLATRHPHIRLVAVSNRHGVAHCSEGLDAAAFFDAWAATIGGPEADLAVRALAQSTAGVTWYDDPNALWKIRADLVIPAARTGEVRLSTEQTENAGAQEVETWFAASGVKAVLEGANAPLTVGAENWLTERGVVVFPDFIVNSGGVWGCWAEWAERASLRAGTRTAEQVTADAEEIIGRVVRANMRRVLAKGGSNRFAADEVKVENVAPVAAQWAALSHIEDIHDRAVLHAQALEL